LLDQSSPAPQRLLDVGVGDANGRRSDADDGIRLTSAIRGPDPLGHPAMQEGGNVVGAADASALDQGWQGVVEVEPARFGAAEG